MSALPIPHRAHFAAAGPLPHPATAPAGDWLKGPLLANRGLFGQVALAAALTNLFALATSLFSMTVYNRIVPSNATASMTALTIGMLLVLAFDFALRTLRGYFADIAAQDIDRRLGAGLFDRLLTLPLADRQGSTGALAGLVREFETLREFFASATVMALVDVPFILLFLTVIAIVAPPLAWVTLAALPIVIGLALLLRPWLDRLSQQGFGEGLSKQGVIVETIAGLETVKTSRAGDLLAARWQAAVAGHARLSLRQRLLAALPVNVAASMQSLVYVVMVAFGVSLIADRSLSMGALVAASMLSGRCVAPLGQIAMMLGRLSQTLQAYRALDRLMRGPSDTPPVTLRRPHLSGRISFRNVGFRYPGSDARALDRISFDIMPGERVAIIGRVGSGKSTIGRLALGLYTPEEGAVLIDDADIRQIHRDDLKANAGAVLQDVVLLSGTIRDNIALGDPAIDDAAVLAAARLAGADEFIGRLPAGYDTRLADRGEGLSGGQRQALAIARALAGDKPILLLDEPTSAMDMASESALVDRLQGQLDGRTMLVITHRESLLRLATRIIIVDAGRIVADGPREQILRALALPAAA